MDGPDGSYSLSDIQDYCEYGCENGQMNEINN